MNRPDDTPRDEARPRESTTARRRRLDSVFGDVLPDSAGDDRPEPDREGRGSDEWLRDQVPPHHG
jgi:hypothetical protein